MHISTIIISFWYTECNGQMDAVNYYIWMWYVLRGVLVQYIVILWSHIVECICRDTKYVTNCFDFRNRKSVSQTFMFHNCSTDLYQKRKVPHKLWTCKIISIYTVHFYKIVPSPPFHSLRFIILNLWFLFVVVRCPKIILLLTILSVGWHRLFAF